MQADGRTRTRLNLDLMLSHASGRLQLRQNALTFFLSSTIVVAKGPQHLSGWWLMWWASLLLAFEMGHWCAVAYNSWCWFELRRWRLPRLRSRHAAPIQISQSPTVTDARGVLTGALGP